MRLVCTSYNQLSLSRSEAAPGVLLSNAILTYPFMSDNMIITVAERTSTAVNSSYRLENIMFNKKKETEQKALKRQVFLEKGFELFSERGIEGVTLKDVADCTDYGIATLYRYFDKKPGFVVAVATWKWEQLLEDNPKRMPSKDFVGMTAAEIFEFYLDSFIIQYREQKSLLRFNQYFNIYVQTEGLDQSVLKPYLDEIEVVKERFHIIYQKAKKDHTIRTDITEEKMFSTTLHLMLAAVTRYAVGLVYIPEKEFDALEELEVQKNAILMCYSNSNR